MMNEAAREYQEREKTYLQQLLRDLENPPWRQSSMKLPSLEELVTAWDDGIEHGFWKPLGKDYEMLLYSLGRIKSEQALHFTLCSLPRLSQTHRDAIYHSGGWESPSWLDYGPILEMINHVFSSAPTPEHLQRGIENVERIPLRLLTKENVFLLPRENYEFFSGILNDLALHMEAAYEVDNPLEGSAPLIPVPGSIDFSTFNSRILRREGKPAGEYEAVLTDVLKKAYLTESQAPMPASAIEADHWPLSDPAPTLTRFLFNFFQRYQYPDDVKMLQQLPTVTALIDETAGSTLKHMLTALSIFAEHRPTMIQPYLEAAVSCNSKEKIDDRFFKLKEPLKDPSLGSIDEFCEYYHALSQGLLEGTSSLFVPSLNVKPITIEAQEFGKTKKGLQEKIKRESDAIQYLFDTMYHLGLLTPLRSRRDLILNNWKKRRQSHLDSALVRQLCTFDFTSFFQDEQVQTKVEIIKTEGSEGEYLFSEHQDFLFSILEQDRFYKKKMSGDARDALRLLKASVGLSFDFDEAKIEYNTHKINSLVTHVGECLSLGEEKDRFLHHSIQYLSDKNLDLLVANIYQQGEFVSTIGKAFLARCKNEQGENVLYIDGIVINQEIANAMALPNTENSWMPSYTKAIIEIARARGLQEIVFNVHHTSAQRSVWQYCKHIADLLGKRNGREYSYKPKRKTLCTTSEAGFRLYDKAAAQNYHYLEKKSDSDAENYYLSGFWINFWDPAQDKNNPKKNYSPIPAFVPRQHQEQPYVNKGKGYIIGFRIATEELIHLFNEQYGKRYGAL